MATRSRSMPAGVDQVVYRLAPNPGEPARPLARIASGGELSRVALAIKQRPGRGRRDADPRLRRGRHRASAGGARTRSAGACGPSPGATRSCASPTCPRSPPTPTPTTGSPSASATAARSPRSSASTARAGSSSSPQMLGGGAGRCRRRWPARASSRPRRGVARRGSRRGRLSAGPRRAATSTAAIEDYLTYLHVERGLAPATIRAYRSRPARLRARRAGSATRWAASPDAAVRYLAARTRRGRRGDPGLAPTQPAPAGGRAQGLLPLRVRRGPDRASTSPPTSTCRASRGSCPRRSTSSRDRAPARGGRR